MAGAKDLMAPALGHQGGILVEAPGGELLALDRFARRAVPIPAHLGSAEEASALLERFNELLSRAEREVVDRSPSFTVHADVEGIYDSAAVRTGILHLLTGLIPNGSVDLALYFSRPPEEWAPLARWLHHLLRQFDPLFRHISLQGPFPALSEAVKEGFANLGLHLGVVTGWWKGCSPAGWARLDRDTLRDLARFGFRVLLVCYVHARNIQSVEAILNPALEANEHSGFALPLASCHPHYDFCPEAPALPDPTAYAELLVRTYRNYPHYDDVFFPITDLASLVGNGGWCGRLEVPARLHLLARPQMGVALFRQLPALARPWLGWEQLLATRREEIVAALLAFQRQQFAWEHNPFCGACRWRYVCGGLDAQPEGAPPAPGVFEAVCVHRKAFLEVLSLERTEAL